MYQNKSRNRNPFYGQHPETETTALPMDNQENHKPNLFQELSYIHSASVGSFVILPYLAKKVGDFSS